MNGLPHLLRQVAELAGLDAALQLARARGGRRLYVPQKPTKRFIADVGEAAAQALSKLYPNEAVKVPLGPTGAHHSVARAAEEAISQGLSTAEVARRTGLTIRTIERRRAKLRLRDDRQGSLFDV